MNRKIIFSGLLMLIAVLAISFMPKLNNKATHGSTALKAYVEKSVEEPGIKFIESNWSKAKAEAKKQNKLIFLDAYTSWCGPCKMLKRNTFPDKAVGEFFNSKFINVALDMEKGDGPAVAALYYVNAYPTLIIADADGKMITYTKGYIEPAQLLEFGKFGLEKGTK